jgi:hypothetical protein
LFASILLAVFATQADAQSKDPPSQADLSRSALEGHLRTTDEKSIASRILDEHRKIRTSAAAAPEADSIATLVFKRGLSEQALTGFLTEQQLELARVELKVPVSQDNRVFTISIGATDLMRFDGELRDQLRKAVGQVRAQFASLADSTRGEESDRFREVAFRRSLDTYKIEAVAPRRTIAALLEHPNIAAVFLDDTDRQVQDFRALQADHAQARRDAGEVISRRMSRPTSPAAVRGTLPQDQLPAAASNR